MSKVHLKGHSDVKVLKYVMLVENVSCVRSFNNTVMNVVLHMHASFCTQMICHLQNVKGTAKKKQIGLCGIFYCCPTKSL